METKTPVNTSIYDELGERWYVADDDPVALLRAESRLRNPWVRTRITAALGSGPRRVLDMGCGGGFLANDLAHANHAVTGVDLSAESLEVARRHDRTGKARYLVADALALPFEPESFDVVCAMDFLEHVESPASAIAEAARVLAPGGLFFFHTFNRTLAARLLVIHGVEWVVRNTPKHLHVYRLFIRPEELTGYCASAGLRTEELVGLEPKILSNGMLALLLRGRVPHDFEFRFTSSLRTGYCGFARSVALTGGR